MMEICKNPNLNNDVTPLSQEDAVIVNRIWAKIAAWHNRASNDPSPNPVASTSFSNNHKEKQGKSDSIENPNKENANPASNCNTSKNYTINSSDNIDKKKLGTSKDNRCRNRNGNAKKSRKSTDANNNAEDVHVVNAENVVAENEQVTKVITTSSNADGVKKNKDIPILKRKGNTGNLIVKFRRIDEAKQTVLIDKNDVSKKRKGNFDDDGSLGDVDDTISEADDETDHQETTNGDVNNTEIKEESWGIVELSNGEDNSQKPKTKKTTVKNNDVNNMGTNKSISPAQLISNCASNSIKTTQSPTSTSVKSNSPVASKPIEPDSSNSSAQRPMASSPHVTTPPNLPIPKIFEIPITSQSSVQMSPPAHIRLSLKSICSLTNKPVSPKNKVKPQSSNSPRSNSSVGLGPVPPCTCNYFAQSPYVAPSHFTTPLNSPLHKSNYLSQENWHTPVTLAPGTTNPSISSNFVQASSSAALYPEACTSTGITQRSYGAAKSNSLSQPTWHTPDTSAPGTTRPSISNNFNQNSQNAINPNAYTNTGTTQGSYGSAKSNSLSQPTWHTPDTSAPGTTNPSISSNFVQASSSAALYPEACTSTGITQRSYGAAKSNSLSQPTWHTPDTSAPGTTRPSISNNFNQNSQNAFNPNAYTYKGTTQGSYGPAKSNSLSQQTWQTPVTLAPGTTRPSISNNFNQNSPNAVNPNAYTNTGTTQGSYGSAKSNSLSQPTWHTPDTSAPGTTRPSISNNFNQNSQNSFNPLGYTHYTYTGTTQGSYGPAYPLILPNPSSNTMELPTTESPVQSLGIPSQLEHVSFQAIKLRNSVCSVTANPPSSALLNSRGPRPTGRGRRWSSKYRSNGPLIPPNPNPPEMVYPNRCNLRAHAPPVEYLRGPQSIINSNLATNRDIDDFVNYVMNMNYSY